jgi:phosphatidylserine/phosphatidylglycerophosphate/cardiolipin synthase-like enzyme
MAMFYLSHRDIVKALLAAAGRGASVRLILDANRDAFGREKNGVPNRPVARELVEKSNGAVQVRWYDTHGEQFHTKMTVVRRATTTRVSLGSSNLTRRNIDDLNLEANLEVVMPTSSPLDLTLSDYFDRLWSNRDGASYTLPYQAFEDHSRLKTVQYRVMEATGLSTF